MNNAIVEYQDHALDEVKNLANLVLALRDQVFKQGQDYGVIPGTDKPTLLLPGMEKLMRALNLRAEYIERHTIRDYDRPLFHFEYECRLVEIDSTRVISNAIGSANSMESKWRWRNADRVCPHCGKATIIKGKAEYGGGWLCFAKKGGCGAKFSDTDVLITSQQVGRVENPDIFDQVNTILKIAQKRALGSAIKGAANVSEFYTVDLEDFQMFDVTPPVVDARVTVEPPSAPSHLDVWTKDQRKAWVAALQDRNWHIDQIKEALGVDLVINFNGTEAEADAALDAAVARWTADAVNELDETSQEAYQAAAEPAASDEPMSADDATQLTKWAKSTHKMTYQALCSALGIDNLLHYTGSYDDAVDAVDAARKAVTA